MNRATVYNVIKKERDYQDMNWSHLGHDPLVKQYHYAAPHILMIEDYARKAQALWTKSKDEVDVLQTIAKLATIAVRALEETIDKDGKTLSRPGVFMAIDAERASQDITHPRTKDNSGQYKFSAPHLLLVEEYAARARNWWKNGDRDGVIRTFVVLAAILVRALEEIDGPDLLYVGLR